MTLTRFERFCTIPECHGQKKLPRQRRAKHNAVAR